MNIERLGLVATIGMVGFFGIAFREAMQFRGIGQWFPLLATTAGLLVALVSLGLQLAGRTVASRSAFDIGVADPPPARPVPPPGGSAVPSPAGPVGVADRLAGPVVLAWVAAFPVLTALVGVTLAVTAWLPAFLLFVAKTGWRVALPTAVGAVLVVTALRLYLGLYLPASILVAG